MKLTVRKAIETLRSRFERVRSIIMSVRSFFSWVRSSFLRVRSSFEGWEDLEMLESWFLGQKSKSYFYPNQF
jgi:hypothetical protein